jgi:hypothetical protein
MTVIDAQQEDTAGEFWADRVEVLTLAREFTQKIDPSASVEDVLEVARFIAGDAL